MTQTQHESAERLRRRMATLAQVHDGRKYSCGLNEPTWTIGDVITDMMLQDEIISILREEVADLRRGIFRHD